MKSFCRFYIVLFCFCILISMAGCDHDITVATTVNDDGSIERTIVLYDADSSKASSNIFGINETGGWSTVIEPTRIREDEGSRKTDVDITFTKRFASTVEANREMDSNVDTLFGIHSTFEKQNRWFYTYIEYSDTYRSLNPFKAIRIEDYFTKEDYAFINRLPAEGKPIPKADSLYLARLNEKIFEIYGARTIFEELYGHMLGTMTEYNLEGNWKDSLARRKEDIYQKFLEDGGGENDQLLDAVDLLRIPLPPAGREIFLEKSRRVEKRIEYVVGATSGKFKHVIRMPWSLIDSNADSVNNNEVHWHPPVIKFLLTDYTMTARSRKMNVWAVVISAGVVIATVGLFFVRRKL